MSRTLSLPRLKRPSQLNRNPKKLRVPFKSLTRSIIRNQRNMVARRERNRIRRNIKRS